MLVTSITLYLAARSICCGGFSLSCGAATLLATRSETGGAGNTYRGAPQRDGARTEQIFSRKFEYPREAFPAPLASEATSSNLPVSIGTNNRHTKRMDSAAKYTLKDLFFEALAIEWRILRTLGQAVAGGTVFVAIQLVNVITYPAAVVIDLLGLFLGFEMRTIVRISAADDIV